MILAVKALCWKKMCLQSQTSASYSKRVTLNAYGECKLTGNHLCRSPDLILLRLCAIALSCSMMHPIANETDPSIFVYPAHVQQVFE